MKSILTALLFMSSVTYLISTNLYVPSQYSTIQSAVSASLNGDEVILADGVYTGASNRGILIENKNITIRSTSNIPSLCVIDCELLDRAFYFGTGVYGASIKGIKMINGRSINAPIDLGGAILMVNSSHIVVENCIFENCSKTAVAIGDHYTGNQNTTLTIINNSIFRYNYQCILSTQQAISITNCLFEFNTGFVWYHGHKSNPVSSLTNSLLRYNTNAIDEQSCLIILCHASTMSNCLIHGNDSDGGTLHFGTIWTGENIVDKCTFYDNQSIGVDTNWYDHLGVIKNSIVWGTGVANDYIRGKFSGISAYNSCLVGSWIGPGSSNIFIDPECIDPSNHDYSLQPYSPCIGTGENGTNMGCDVTLLPTFDYTIDFVGTPTIGVMPLSVSFQSSPALSPTATIAWDFENDGIIDSNDPSPTHTYTQPGVYSVKLIVQSVALSDSIIKENYITVLDQIYNINLISNSPLNLGSVYVEEESDYQAVKFTNTGTMGINISDVHLISSSSHFEFANPFRDLIIAPGATDSIIVRFTPRAVGALFDTLYIVNNSTNHPVLKIRLNGNGLHVLPKVPDNLTITMIGNSAQLSWDPVTHNMHNEPLVPDYYFVWFNGLNVEDAPYYFLAPVTETTYTHVGVALGAQYMFYRVTAIKFYRADTSSGLLDSYLRKNLLPDMSESEVEAVLKRVQ